MLEQSVRMQDNLILGMIWSLDDPVEKKKELENEVQFAMSMGFNRKMGP